MSSTITDDAATTDKMQLWPPEFPTPDQTVVEPEAVLALPGAEPGEDESTGNEPTQTTEHIGKANHEDMRTLVRLSGPRVPHRSFEVLQQWEGIVSEITADSFWVDLVDITDRTKPEEIVELPLDEISEADRPILKLGSVIYWAIGREWSPGGQMRRVSEIRVRRTPQWSQRSIDKLKVKAITLMERFESNAGNSTATPP